MSRPIEQIGNANRIITSVANHGAKEIKRATNRWRRRRWRQDPEATLPKYRGSVA